MQIYFMNISRSLLANNMNYNKVKRCYLLFLYCATRIRETYFNSGLFESPIIFLMPF